MYKNRGKNIKFPKQRWDIEGNNIIQRNKGGNEIRNVHSEKILSKMLSNYDITIRILHFKVIDDFLDQQNPGMFLLQFSLPTLKGGKSYVKLLMK